MLSRVIAKFLKGEIISIPRGRRGSANECPCRCLPRVVAIILSPPPGTKNVTEEPCTPRHRSGFTITVEVDDTADAPEFCSSGPREAGTIETRTAMGKRQERRRHSPWMLATTKRVQTVATAASKNCYAKPPPRTMTRNRNSYYRRGNLLSRNQLEDAPFIYRVPRE